MPNLRSITGESFLIYIGGERFASQLVMREEDVLPALLTMIYGELPTYKKDPEAFDEMVTLRNDFKNESFWKEGGCLWESDFSEGYVVAVKVQTRLN